MKTISVLISGQGGDDALREVELQPGSNAADLLQALGLPDSYLLSSADGSRVFASDEDLYPILESGCKVRCVPQATVGIMGD